MNKTIIIGTLLISPLLCAANDIEAIFTEITAAVARASPHVEASSPQERSTLRGPSGAWTNADVEYFPHAAEGDQEYYVKASCSKDIEHGAWECETVVSDRSRRPAPERDSPLAEGDACLGVSPLSFLEVAKTNGSNCWEHSGIDYGVAMWGVAGGSPAEFAGIRAGDFMLSLNEVALDAPGILTSLLEKSQPGDQFSARLYRSGQFIDVTGGIGAFDGSLCR